MSEIAANSSVIGLFPDLAGTGGVQESGRLIALALEEIAQQRGWRVDFLSLNGAPGHHSLAFGNGSIPFRGFDRWKVRFALSAMRSVRRSARAGNTVVLATHPNLAPVAAWMKRVSPSTKTIVVAHGIEVWTPLSSSRRRALAAADLVLAPSRFTMEKMAAAQQISTDKIRRLPWPVSPSFLTLADSPGGLRVPEGFPKGQIILTVGRWASNERYKGADELIRVIALLRHEFRSVQLAAIGSGDDLPRLRQLASELGAADRVHFLEGLSREQIAASYAASDVFALPSTGEGFGIVFLEAMALAKPVVGAAAGGVTDIVEDGVNGLLVPASDADALRRALEKLLREPRLREQLGRNGARKIREKYSFDAFRGDLEAVAVALMHGGIPQPEPAFHP